MPLRGNPQYLLSMTSLGDLRGLVVLGLVFVVLVSCDDAPPECSTIEDCPTGSICLDGRCTPTATDGDADGDSDGDGDGDGDSDADSDADGDGDADGDADADSACSTGVVCGTPPVCCSVEEECVGGTCRPACLSGVRCGLEHDTCCGAGQVCVTQSCVDPGAECSDSFECPMSGSVSLLLVVAFPSSSPSPARRLRSSANFPSIDNTSATIHEYPLVADVDGDGNSEIVIVANNRSAGIPDSCRAADADYAGERQGIFVYGDARDQWMRTRRIWNQHAYHVTNVGTHGEIPTIEANNWDLGGLNNYRQNAQGEGVYNAPDLTVLALEVDLTGCPTTAVLRARVSNEGNLGVGPGVPVAFYMGTALVPGDLLGVVLTDAPLLPGASVLVAQEIALEGFGPWTFVAFVDDDGTGVGIVTECDEDDNAEGIGDINCDLII